MNEEYEEYEDTAWTEYDHGPVLNITVSAASHGKSTITILQHKRGVCRTLSQEDMRTLFCDIFKLLGRFKGDVTDDQFHGMMSTFDINGLRI